MEITVNIFFCFNLVRMIFLKIISNSCIMNPDFNCLQEMWAQYYVTLCSVIQY